MLLLFFFLIEKIHMFCLNHTVNWECGGENLTAEKISAFFYWKNTIFPRFDVFVPFFREGVQIYLVFTFRSMGAVHGVDGGDSSS